MARIVAHHGTCRDFDRFDADRLGSFNPGATCRLGFFLSTDPRIAAHFVLRPEVIERGYDSEEGSAAIIKDPFRLDPDPFEDGARVLECELALISPARLALRHWMGLVARDDPREIDGLRRRFLRGGHDGLLIPAWDGDVAALDEDDDVPCVEYRADTWIAFRPEAIRIVGWREPASLWPHLNRKQHLFDNT